ncbi:hypothetical protein BHE97_07105 [Aeromicrobium sp. PE09-221]|uniref:nitroreductase n=1 Tax=Aeromicrobium sp. PE09-221 TaxID=1898043 RepID=UPI000B3EE289|nr:nitroreductase [Aeromicrobium sp. PE09-221]OUZ10519.1 hypothetical protein BHE97_07105 [Aeromicrobium sp. PE09-221]
MVTSLRSFDELAAARWSCRGYEPEPVPQEILEAIATTAQRAPSWCNTQPWHTEIVSGAELDRLRKALAEDGRWGSDFAFPERYEGVYRDRRREVAWQLYDAVGVERGDRAASGAQTMLNFEFFGAPHAAFITVPTALGVYALADAGAYVQTFLLAVESHGLGAIAQAALAQKADFLREWFDWDEDRSLVCAISFGRPDRGHPANSFRSHRVPVAEAVRFHG